VLLCFSGPVISSKKANKKKSKKNGSDNEDEEAEGTTAGTVVTVALLVAPNKAPPVPVKKVKGKGEELERVFLNYITEFVYLFIFLYVYCCELL
jgi:hypothetical protein